MIGSGADINGGKVNDGSGQLTDVVIDSIEPSAGNVIPGSVQVNAVEEEPAGEH